MRELVLSIPELNLYNLVRKQLNNQFPDDHKINAKILKNCIKKSLIRLRKNFDKINLKYYTNTQNTVSYFNHLHGDHYSMFLYFISNEAYLSGDEVLASKLFLLNKCLFSLDVFYSIKLPDHFLFVHPIGTVIGNANFENFFVIYQGVTVGSTNNGFYPNFSNSTILYSNSSIIGECNTGKNFVLGANSSLINTNVLNDKIVVGNFPNHSILENKSNLISKYFNI
jgi:serine O-acetyltransferase